MKWAIINALSYSNISFVLFYNFLLCPILLYFLNYCISLIKKKNYIKKMYLKQIWPDSYNLIIAVGFVIFLFQCTVNLIHGH